MSLERINVSNHGFDVDKKPNTCPICHIYMLPIAVHGLKNKHKLEIVFKCVNQECGKLFISYFIQTNTTFSFESSIPKTFISRSFTDAIKEVSSNFEIIYNQSAKAESDGLNHICGPGYRKALEFIIKDYLISQIPEKAEQIKNMFLGNCIKEFIADHNIKICAERATWIGNDETHYTRTWEDRDISHLKELIDLTIHWISSEIITRKYKDEMPTRR